MKRFNYSPDHVPLRHAAYSKRLPAILEALWSAIEHLDNQGIDIGDTARTELDEIAIIKEKYKER